MARPSRGNRPAEPSRRDRNRPRAKKPPLTHFLCLPLVTRESRPRLERSVEIFRDAVTSRGPDRDTAMNDYGSDGGEDSDDGKHVQTIGTVHPKAIRPVGTLHLTLGVMSLSDGQLQQAITLLESLSLTSLLEESQEDDGSMSGSDAGTSTAAPGTTITTITTTNMQTPTSATATTTAMPTVTTTTTTSSSPATGLHVSPLTIDLRGLVSMHPPERTSILYCAPTDPTDRLERVCLEAQSRFRQHGVLVPDDRPLKLHATVVNTIYAKGRHHGRRGHRTTTSKPSASRPTGAPTNPFAGDDANDDVHVDAARNDDNADTNSGHGPDANAPLRLDARALLARFQDFVWAEHVTLERLAICEMGAQKVLDAAGQVVDEAYTEVASVRLVP